MSESNNKTRDLTAEQTSIVYQTNIRKIIPFTELCRCGDEIWIELEGQIYRLRRTKQGKLVLTK